MLIDKQKFDKNFKILYGFSLIILTWILGYLLNYSSIVGGKLFFYVLIPIGSLNLLYFLFYLYRIKGTNKKFFKKDIFDRYLNKQKLVFLFTWAILFFIFTMPYFYVQGSLLLVDEEKELQNVVFDLIKYSTNETEKINSILAWFNKDENGPENFSSIYHHFRNDEVLLYLGDFFYFEDDPKICIRGGSKPYTVFMSRSGRCGEYSSLFAEMGRIAGLNVSTVDCTGENHAWNEVYLDDNHTIIVDASAVRYPRSTGIMSPEFMQLKVKGDWREKKEYPKEGNISYVYCQFPNDNKKYDVTERYTDTINLTFNITDSKGNPLKNVKVKIISHNRPNWVQSIGIDKTTNKSGQCTFKIGGGRYHFSFQADGDWFPVETDIKWFFEDEEQQYFNYEYRKYSIFDNPIHLSMILIAILIIVGLIIGLYKFHSQKYK